MLRALPYTREWSIIGLKLLFMHYQTSVFVLLSLFYANTCRTQTLEILRQSDYRPPEKTRFLDYIEPATDTAGFVFIASLKASGGETGGVGPLYYKIWNKAIQLRANAYRLMGYEPGDSTHTPTLLLDCYYTVDTLLKLNARHHEKNVVYVFGSVEPHGKSYSVKIDNVKKDIAGGTYFRYPIVEKQEVKVATGGFGGATAWIKWGEDRTAVFLTLSGFGLAGAPYQPRGVAVGFSLHQLNYMDDGLGYLLVQVLKKEE